MEVTANMLVPIVSVLLKSGLAATEFMSAAKLAYARAAVSEVAPSTKRINISRISASTGLTRREVTNLLRPPSKKSIAKMAVGQPLLRVVHGWQQDRRFSHRSGQPKVLTVSGNGNTFEGLVRSHGGDVTVVGVLKELERLHCVRRIGKDRVRLVRKYLTQSGYDRQALGRYGRKLTDYAESLDSQFKPAQDRVYLDVIDNCEISTDMLPIFRKTFAERAAMLLGGFETWSKRNALRVASEKSQRVGLGVYLIAPMKSTQKKS